MGSTRVTVPQLALCVLLSDALRRARRGELASVAVVGIKADGEVFEAFETGSDAGPLIDAIHGLAKELGDTAPESGPSVA